MKILGRNLAIFTTQGDTYTPIGLSTACSLSITSEMTEVVAADSQSKRFIPGRYTYSLKVDRLYDGGDMMYTLINSLKTRRALNFAFCGADAVGGEMIPISGGLRFAGSGYVTDIGMNAPVAGYATVNISMQGTGELIVERGDTYNLDLGDAASAETGVIDLEDAASTTTGIIDLGNA